MDAEETVTTLTTEELAAAMVEATSETPLHRFLGLTMTVATREQVVVEMPVAPNAFNATVNLHGGALATLCDVCSGSAAVLGSGFRPGLESLVTADLHIRYLGRPLGDLVRAVAQVRKAGRQLIVVECNVYDLQGRTVAVADFSAMIVPLRAPLVVSDAALATHPDL